MSASWISQQTCTRKKRYATYEQAKTVLAAMREAGRDSILLHVYRCPVGRASRETEHFHLGNARGREARRLIKRHNKQQRKALWKPSFSPVERGE